MTPKELKKYYPHLYTITELSTQPDIPCTHQQITIYVQQRHKNGLAPAIKKVSGSIYIDKIQFLEWLKAREYETVTLDEDQYEELELSNPIARINFFKNEVHDTYSKEDTDD